MKNARYGWGLSELTTFDSLDVKIDSYNQILMMSSLLTVDDSISRLKKNETEFAVRVTTTYICDLATMEDTKAIGFHYTKEQDRRHVRVYPVNPFNPSFDMRPLHADEAVDAGFPRAIPVEDEPLSTENFAPFTRHHVGVVSLPTSEEAMPATDVFSRPLGGSIASATDGISVQARDVAYDLLYADPAKLSPDRVRKAAAMLLKLAKLRDERTTKDVRR